jgi:gamma-glutamylcyclotransferase (GGCT)/AIG2-like uncharacterized protein YtfP
LLRSEGRKPKRAEMLIMFFYGTLKRGERNYERYCSGALRVEEATVRGDLYDIPLMDYPALVVPEESIFGFGTNDPTRDVEEQWRLGGVVPSPGGPRVYGEIFAFDDPESRLPALDRLEGFVPADASNQYRRVLLPVETDAGSSVLAWAYAVKKSPGVHLPGGRWPP